MTGKWDKRLIKIIKVWNCSNRSSGSVRLPVALCRMQCINLKKDRVKILGRQFLNNMTEKEELLMHIAKTGVFWNYGECRYL